MRQGLLLLLANFAVVQLEQPVSNSNNAHVRLGIIDVQAGSRGAPQRIVFAVPSFWGVQAQFFDLLLGRALLGVCVDRTMRSRAGLRTRALRRNATVTLATDREKPPEVWDALVQAANDREAASSEAQAQVVVLFLRGKNVSGIGFVHTDDLDDIEEPFISGAVVISGHRFITEMYEAAQKRRSSGKQCMVHAPSTQYMT